MKIVIKNKELLKSLLKKDEYKIHFYKRLVETSSFP